MGRSVNSELRKKILAEAIGIVYREGPKSVTMRSLAEKLGYSAATIYLHFENKEELLQEIALHGFDVLTEAMEPASEIEEPAAALSEALHRYIAFGVEHGELYRLMFEEIGPEPLRAQLTPEEEARATRPWNIGRDIYARGMENGIFKPGDPDLEASIGWALLHGFVQLSTPGQLLLKGEGSQRFRELREAVVNSRIEALGCSVPVPAGVPSMTVAEQSV